MTTINCRIRRAVRLESSPGKAQSSVHFVLGDPHATPHRWRCRGCRAGRDRHRRQRTASAAASRLAVHPKQAAAAPEGRKRDYREEDRLSSLSLLWLLVDAVIRGVALLGGAAATYIGVMWAYFSRVPMQQWKSEHYALAGPPYDDHVPCSHCMPPLSGEAQHATFWYLIKLPTTCGLTAF